MKVERTTWNDYRFKELTSLLDMELQGNYGELQKEYNHMNIIENDAHVVLCIFDDKAIACGCIRNTDNENSVELKRMYTIKSERGKGIGKILVKELEKWTKELGKNEIVLETGVKQESAIKMYTNLGFKVIENYGKYKGNSNSICMAKNI